MRSQRRMRSSVVALLLVVSGALVLTPTAEASPCFAPFLMHQVLCFLGECVLRGNGCETRGVEDALAYELERLLPP